MQSDQERRCPEVRSPGTDRNIGESRMKTIDGTGQLSSQPPSVTGRDSYIVGQAMPDQLSPRVAALLKKTQATRGRLIFALDATASREPTWDMAAQLQARCSKRRQDRRPRRAAGLLPRHDEVRQSSWLSDAARARQPDEHDRVHGRAPPRSRGYCGISEPRTSARRSAQRSSSATRSRSRPANSTTPRRTWACRCSCSRRATAR